MKTSEIRALQKNCKWQMDTFDKISYDNTVALMSLVETMLAREVEVLVKLKHMHTLSRDDNVNVALWNALDAARAILNPEGE